MSTKVAGIDVHKKVLMVVVHGPGAAEQERGKFGTTTQQLRQLAAWLRERHVEEAVMESTAQYWKPVWYELEPHIRLHLAQAYSNRAPRGRKHDFKDAERLVRRLIAKELILSFVPDGEQRIWRNMTRMKLQLVRDRVRLHSQIECLLEEMRIKLSVVVSDLLGLSGLRILDSLAKGETDAKSLASLGDDRLKCTEEQLIEALTGSSHPLHRQMLGLKLERLRLIDDQIAKLNSLIAEAMTPHQDTVVRLAEVPGLGIDSAQQVIAEVGPTAATFPSAAELTSWVGTCPGKEESAEENSSSRSAKGNKYMRRVSTRLPMLLREAKAPTSRLSSGVSCRASVINQLSGQSRIVYAAWSGRFSMRESATSSKVLSQNPSSSSIGRNTSPSNCESLATKSTSLRQTVLQHRAHRIRSVEVIFDGVGHYTTATAGRHVSRRSAHSSSCSGRQPKLRATSGLVTVSCKASPIIASTAWKSSGKSCSVQSCSHSSEQKNRSTVQQFALVRPSSLRYRSSSTRLFFKAGRFTGLVATLL